VLLEAYARRGYHSQDQHVKTALAVFAATFACPIAQEAHHIAIETDALLPLARRFNRAEPHMILNQTLGDLLTEPRPESTAFCVPYAFAIHVNTPHYLPHP
jgi:hypothetical protein